jgi:hypothetical protein
LPALPHEERAQHGAEEAARGAAPRTAHRRRRETVRRERRRRRRVGNGLCAATPDPDDPGHGLTCTRTLHIPPHPTHSTRADLSHVLALHYGLVVVGIDAEESNTKGAEVHRVRGRLQPCARGCNPVLEAAALCSQVHSPPSTRDLCIPGARRSNPGATAAEAAPAAAAAAAASAAHRLEPRRYLPPRA